MYTAAELAIGLKMTRRQTTVAAEQTSFLPPIATKPKKQRVVTEEQFYAAIATDLMKPDPRRRKGLFAVNILHLRKLCWPKGGEKPYDPMDVIECWQNLVSDNSVAGRPLDGCTLLAVLSSTPPLIEQWIEWMLDLPAVYLIYEHDTAVRTRAPFLKRRGWKYAAGGLPSRIPSDEIQELGL